MKRLYRSTTDRIVSGVCGGIAEYLNVDPTLIRVVFVIAVLIGGVSVFVYIVAIFIIPTDKSSQTPSKRQSTPPNQKEVFQEEGMHAKKSSKIDQSQPKSPSSKIATYVTSAFFIVIGIAFLAVTLGWIDVGNMWKFFLPSAIILIGILLLIGNLKN